MLHGGSTAHVHLAYKRSVCIDTRRMGSVHPPERVKDLDCEWTTGIEPNADIQIVFVWVALQAAASSHKMVFGQHQWRQGLFASCSKQTEQGDAVNNAWTSPWIMDPQC